MVLICEYSTHLWHASQLFVLEQGYDYLHAKHMYQFRFKPANKFKAGIAICKWEEYYLYLVRAGEKFTNAVRLPVSVLTLSSTLE